jgi:UDP-4-amino-4-deoxy-L-arabinose formyltransferase/UDP-glucuronic acid dehydrogenase (UDP-4-keto-hexauronic acid decarboxylating)
VLVLSSGATSGAASVAGVAASLELPVLPASNVRDPAFAGRLRAARVDLLLNVHSLHLIAREVLEAPRVGSFNVHPGPLPAWAGLSVPSWAIYHGVQLFGCTLHWMAVEVDAGPIAFAAGFPVEERETGLSLSLKCAREGVVLVRRLVETAMRDPDAIPRQPQADGERRWFGRPPPHGGRVPWNLSARRVDGFVRACDFAPFPSPWGRPRTTCAGRELAVLKTMPTGVRAAAEPGTVARDEQGGVVVATGDDWLRVERVVEKNAALDPRDALPEGAWLPSPEEPAP